MTLGKLPPPAGPGPAAPASGAADDLLGLMGGMEVAAPAPSDGFGSFDAAPAPAAAFAPPSPMGGGNADAFAATMGADDFGDFGGAEPAPAPAAPAEAPKSAMDSMLEASVTGFSLGDAPAPAAAKAPAPSGAPMGAGSGLGNAPAMAPPGNGEMSASDAS